VTQEEVARHEAGHVAACLTLKIPVTMARIEWGPYGLTGGRTRSPDLFDGLDRDHARKVCRMLMAGWIMEPRELSAYPPGADSDQLDERWLSSLVRYLKLDEPAYYGLRSEAFTLTTEDEFVNTFETTVGIFERMPVIDEAGIRLAQRVGGVR
jgi:hypothetical protein